jgi:hypothetical protein
VLVEPPEDVLVEPLEDDVFVDEDAGPLDVDTIFTGFAPDVDLHNAYAWDVLREYSAIIIETSSL